MPLNAWLPYIADRVPLAANEEDILYVKDDAAQGLGAAGQSGIIENYGPGLLTYKISDDGERFMVGRTLNPGAHDIYLVGEKVKIHTIIVQADAAGAVYSVNITLIAPEEGVEE